MEKWIVVGIGVFLFFIFVWFISTHNKLKRLQVKVQEADSGIDVALTKRYDTLTKMYDVAKGYLKQEQTVIWEAIRLRQHMPVDEKAEAARLMDEASRQLNLVAEAYPVLTSQALYMELQRAVADTEEHLQAARRLFNANVSILNQLVVTFPNSVVAGLQGIKCQPMFAAEVSKRADVSLKS